MTDISQQTELLAQLDDVVMHHRRYRIWLEEGVYSFPAEQFENEVGLIGISCRYNLPEGENERDMFLEMFCHDLKLWILDGKSDGLEQLAKQPDPETITACRTLVEAELHNAVEACYATLESLNPSLRPLGEQAETSDQKYNVVKGVLSRFNIPDIVSYSIDGKKGNVADPARDSRKQAIEQATGAMMRWAASSSTQHRILQQIKQRELLEQTMQR
jgi:hypothetical protein